MRCHHRLQLIRREGAARSPLSLPLLFSMDEVTGGRGGPGGSLPGRSRLLPLRLLFSLLLLFLLLHCGESRLSAPSSDQELVPRIFSVVCYNRIEGCPCFRPDESGQKRAKGEPLLRLPHALAVYNPVPAGSHLYRITRPEGSCLFPARRLRPRPYTPRLRASVQNRSHALLPLERMVRPGQPEDAWPKEGKSLRKWLDSLPAISLGRFWPTYYHMAMEEFHPGKPVRILSRTGESLGEASLPFLRQVTWEGSGLFRDGRHIRHADVVGRYEFFQDASWSWGVDRLYQLYPYRSVAVNFPGLCEKLGEAIPHCTREAAIGLLLRIPRIANAKVSMEGGAVHDGYFCAVDTGSPHYIRADRMDLFVGVRGGGNPYLPPARRPNRLIEAGFPPLVPWDWKLWKGERKRVWCDRKRLPRDPHHPAPGECTLDYHTTALEKSLEVEAVLGPDNSPVKCRQVPRPPGDQEKKL